MSTIGSDYSYTELLKIMREQGKKDNPTTLQIGIMQSSNSVKINDLILYSDDIYIADHLVSGGLNAGDLVAIQRLNDKNKYVILVKVVSV